jgi:hypothetical protein
MLLAIAMLHRKMICFIPFFMDDHKTMSTDRRQDHQHRLTDVKMT